MARVFAGEPADALLFGWLVGYGVSGAVCIYMSLSDIEPVMAFTPSVGVAQGGALLFHLGPDTDPVSLANFTAIPHISSDVSLRPTFANETKAPQYTESSQRSATQKSHQLHPVQGLTLSGNCTSQYLLKQFPSRSTLSTTSSLHWHCHP